jgi:hypothetical protein
VKFSARRTGSSSGALSGRSPCAGVAGADQQRVAVAERDVEHAGEQLHHLAAQLGAAGLQEAQMAGGDPGLGGQRQLAHAPRGSPSSEDGAERGGDVPFGKPKQRVHRDS